MALRHCALCVPPLPLGSFQEYLPFYLSVCASVGYCASSLCSLGYVVSTFTRLTIRNDLKSLWMTRDACTTRGDEG
jgi:hypothetical protein